MLNLTGFHQAVGAEVWRKDGGSADAPLQGCYKRYPKCRVTNRKQNKVTMATLARGEHAGSFLHKLHSMGQAVNVLSLQLVVVTSLPSLSGKLCRYRVQAQCVLFLCHLCGLYGQE